jgi:hypothetical protein
MLTSIIEPGTFMVGTKIFKAGQVVPLIEEEQTELDAVVEIFAEWNKGRTDLLNACHLSEDPFVLDLATQAHDMKIQNFHLRYRLNLLIAAIEKRFGGLLPIYFSSVQKQLYINEKPEDALVYTIKYIGDTIGMPAFAFPRNIATAIVGKKNVFFDADRDEVVSCISVFGHVAAEDQDTWAENKAAQQLDVLSRAIEGALVADGPTAMSLIVLWGASSVRVINADAIPSTVDPNTRALWNLEKILKEEDVTNGISIAIEKAEQAKMTFFISHLRKGEDPVGAEVIHTLAPTRETEHKVCAPNFAITRMTPDAISELLV